jgi:hypothetical protein
MRSRSVKGRSPWKPPEPQEREMLFPQGMHKYGPYVIDKAVVIVVENST